MLNKVPNQPFITLDGDPVIVSITISPENPAPLSTITFTAEIKGENISEVYMKVKEMNEDMCMPTRNISMNKVNEGIYICNVTLEFADATYFVYKPLVFCNGLWYEFEWRNQTLYTEGTIFYVGGTGEGNYTSIRDAIDNASDGDTVFVYDDSSPYYENVYVDTSINLIGEDKYSTIIDGNGIGDVIYIATDFVNISSFTINNSGLLNSGIEIRTNYNVITNNIISNNYQGLYLYQSLSNIISNNSILNSWVGINLELFSDNNTIIGNQVTNNNFGIILCPTKNVDILKNNISNNFEFGVCLSYQSFNDDIYCSDENTIQKNNFFNNGLHAFFIAGSKNSWNQNFWGRVRFFPKIIYGLIVVDYFYSLDLYPFIPWICIDWHPAKEPYDIEV